MAAGDRRFGEDTTVSSAAGMAQLELELRQWGYYFGAPIRDDEQPRRARRIPTHLIERARQFAPGKSNRKSAAPRAVSSLQRRYRMGEAAGLLSKDGHPLAVPLYAVDAVRCKETKHYGPRGAGSGDRAVAMQAPPEIERLNREINELEQFDLLRGLCLRAQYCNNGDRVERCHWVTREFRKVSHYAAPVTEAKFKNEVAFAKVWLLARLTDPRRTLPA